MIYNKEIILKDGRTCIIRNGTEEDGQGTLDNFILTHEETDNLINYPDEIKYTVEDEAKLMKTKQESPDMVELLAVIDGRIVGIAGIDPIGRAYKLKHRANFGISIEKAYWGLGIGRALMEGCIECARKAGYKQVELDVRADNTNAIALYESFGFVEYGRNPMGFNSRITGMQELVYMRLDLEEQA